MAIHDREGAPVVPYVTAKDAGDLMFGPDGPAYLRAQVAGLGRLKAKWDAAMVAGYITADRTKKSNDRLSGLWFWWCDLNDYPWVVVYTYSRTRRVDVEMDLIGQRYRLSDDQCVDLDRAIAEIGGRRSPYEIRAKMAGHTYTHTQCDAGIAPKIAEAMLAAGLNARRDDTGIARTRKWGPS